MNVIDEPVDQLVRIKVATRQGLLRKAATRTLPSGKCVNTTEACECLVIYCGSFEKNPLVQTDFQTWRERGKEKEERNTRKHESTLEDLLRCGSDYRRNEIIFRIIPNEQTEKEGNKLYQRIILCTGNSLARTRNNVENVQRFTSHKGD